MAPSLKRRAFTLIELLVVVAIIALLMAILLPSLGRAKEQARSAGCLSNLKQIALGVTMYASEYDGVVIPTDFRWDAGMNYFYGQAGHESWATLLIYTGVMPKADASIGTLGHYPPFNTRSSFYCPSGLVDTASYEGDPSAPAPSSHPPVSITDPNGARPNIYKSTVYKSPAHVWYGVNGRTWSIDAASGTSGPPVHIFPLHRVPDDNYPNDSWMPKISSLPVPGSLVMAFDGYQWNMASPNDLAKVNARHNNYTVTNVAMFDGHAESFLRSRLPLPGQETTLNAPNPQTLTNAFPYPYWRIDQGQ